MGEFAMLSASAACQQSSKRHSQSRWSRWLNGEVDGSGNASTVFVSRHAAAPRIELP